jgi:hypothetical protein
MEVKVIARSYLNPAEAEKELQTWYEDGWRLVAVSSFMGHVWYYLHREIP